MMPASFGRLVLVSLLAVAAGAVGHGARAASINSTYDMNRLLSEPHPLSGQMGTRWRPAPVDPRTLATPPAAQPGGALPVIQPAILLPMPPGQPLPAAPAVAPTVPGGDATGLKPRLDLDDAGTIKPGPGARAAPAAPAPAVAAVPWVSPDGPVAPAAPAGARSAAAPTGSASPVRVAQAQAQAPARAAAPAPAGRQGGGLGIFSEIRVGALAHDTGPFSHNKEDGVDTNIELLFVSPDILKRIGAPRPHIGGDINSAGNTSSVHLGLRWEWDFWRFMFGGFSLGGAWHNGETTDAPLDRKELGCSVLFRESVELGVRVGERHSVSGFFDHISNAKLCSTNEGLENVGVRYGYKF